jgi:hypothetical protein
VRAAPNPPLPTAGPSGEVEKWHRWVEGGGGSSRWLEPKRGEEKRGNGGPGVAQPSRGEGGGL